MSEQIHLFTEWSIIDKHSYNSKKFNITIYKNIESSKNETVQWHYPCNKEWDIIWVKCKFNQMVLNNRQN